MKPALLLLLLLQFRPPMGQPLSSGTSTPSATAPATNAPAASADAPAPATKRFSFPDLNIRCDVPLTWTYRDARGTVLQVVNWERKKEFFIRVYPYAGTKLQADTVAALAEPALLQNGYSISDRQWVKLNGINFFEVSAAKDEGNKSINVSSYVVSDHLNVFVVTLLSHDGKPSDDAELKGLLNSFNFINPPASTAPASEGPAHKDEVD
jgi:hypothetical protein